MTETPPILLPEPSADMGSRAPGPLRWGAIALGVAVDVGGTQLCTTAISMLVGIRATIRQPQATLDPVSTQAAALHITMSGGRLYALLTVVGLLCSVAGGYLTAYVARTEVLLNAAVMGMCSGIVGLLMAGASSRSSLTWSFFALTATTIPAAALGGLVCHLARPRD